MRIDLTDYVTVAERLAMAHADGISSISTGAPVMLTDTSGYVQTVVTLRDGRWSTGTAGFRFDLTGTRAQATSPLEDAETSAVGRALALLGYASSRSLASRDEMIVAQRNADADVPAARSQRRTAAERRRG